MLVKNLFKYWTYQVFSPGTVVREKYEAFKSLLAHDKIAHELMADLEEIYYGRRAVDFQKIIGLYEKFSKSVQGMVQDLSPMYPNDLGDLKAYFKKFDFYIRFMLAKPEVDPSPPYILFPNQISTGMEAVAGGKSVALSHVKNQGMVVPKGFTITTNAFYAFMETNGLESPIDMILENLNIHNPQALEQESKRIQKIILAAHLPEPVRQAMAEGVNTITRNSKKGLLAVRSSGAMEDSDISFAGQYESLLNVTPDNIFQAYKSVIASKYSARSMYYRICHGILDAQTPMAVLVLEMVDSLASGVVYTRNPDSIHAPEMMIHATPGLGEALVEGRVSTERIRISHSDNPRILEIKTGSGQRGFKTEKFTEEQVPDKEVLAQSLSIDKKTAMRLAQKGRDLEAFFNRPQDIEWSLDKRGRLFILQSRPLATQSTKFEPGPEPESRSGSKNKPPPANKILISGGETACPGSAMGRVYKLESEADLAQVPKGAVVVARTASPGYVPLMGRAAAFVTDMGSRAGHFASVAREFNIPALVNTGNAFDLLAQGSLVTVDAKNKVVYEGKAKTLLDNQTSELYLLEDSPFQRRLRYVINFISPLKLVDPNSPAFAPGECRSLHDIIRFSHETAVREMFSIGGGRQGGRKKGAKKLISAIPMLFYVLDVGGGLKETSLHSKEVGKEDILSLPMNAVMKGLAHPKIIWSDFSHFDWESYDKIVMAGGIISADDAQFGSYAVVAKEYLNINLRFGYHFVILDTYCSPASGDNYILFRFSGGGGNAVGKSLRAGFIGRVLEKLGFKVNTRSDLVDGEFRQGDPCLIAEKLDYLGRLLGATRLMDMYLKETLDIEELVGEFMAGRYDFRSVPNEKPNE